MKRNIIIAYLIVLSVAQIKCSNNDSEQIRNVDSLVNAYKIELDSTSERQIKSPYQEDDVYEMIMFTFEGFPLREDVEPLLVEVLKKYKLPIKDNIIKSVASVLIDLKNQSVLGVTEMDILKHIYQKGDPRKTFNEQAVFSFNFLESTK